MQAQKAAGDIEGARNHYGVVTKLDPDFVAGWGAGVAGAAGGQPRQSHSTRQKGLSKVSALDAECSAAKVRDCGTPTLWRWLRAAEGLACDYSCSTRSHLKESCWHPPRPLAPQTRVGRPALQERCY